MTLTFKAGWQKPPLQVVPVLPVAPTNRQQKNHDYIVKNNQKRKDGAVFLSFFDENAVRNAVQRANPQFNTANGVVKNLLNGMISATDQVEISQGTHQVEDVTTGGFKLHFDAIPSSGKCFHLYVQQAKAGYLMISEISYRDNGGIEQAFPSQLG